MRGVTVSQWDGVEQRSALLHSEGRLPVLHHLQHDEALLQPGHHQPRLGGLQVQQQDGRGVALHQAVLPARPRLGGVAGPVSQLQRERMNDVIFYLHQYVNQRP